MSPMWEAETLMFLVIFYEANELKALHMFDIRREKKNITREAVILLRN